MQLRTVTWTIGFSIGLGVFGCNDDGDADKTDPTAMASTPVAGHASTSAMTGASNVSEQFLADSGEGWKTLLANSWELDANQERYRCVRFTLPKDVTIGSFRALSPLGTHHTFLTVVDESKKEPDGVTDCNANTNGSYNIQGSGVGTNDINLPNGIAMELKAGQQLLLNLHIFNLTDKPIRGTSGTLIKTLEPNQVIDRAEIILAGSIMIALPPGEKTTIHGTCTMSDDVTLFAAGAHMHQLGVHLKAVAHSSSDGEVVLLDKPYSFDEQLLYPLAKQVKMKTGDKVEVDCTYVNTTDKNVGFGESSLDEMCFSTLYRYPKTGASFGCVF